MEGYIALLLESIKVDSNRLREIMSEHLGESWSEVVSSRTFARVQNYSEVDRDLLQKIADEMEREGFINFEIDVSGVFYGQ